MPDLLIFPSQSATQPPHSAPPDAPVRREALDTRRSFIVEAPAGSGKTGLLIQRFLKLLADPSVTQPEQVLAITFTNAATADLRNRIIKQLESVQQLSQEIQSPTLSLSDPDDFRAHTRDLAHLVLLRSNQLGWHLLTQPHRLNIRTIDSVCAQIARTLPVLSGSGGNLVPAIDADPLYREAARHTLLLLGTGNLHFDAALRDLLLHRDGNLADCESLLAEMLRLRDQWATLFPLDPTLLDDDGFLDADILPRLQRALEDAICASLTRFTQTFPPDILRDLATLSAEMAHLDGYKGNPSPIALCLGRTGSPAGQAADLDHWRALIHLLIKPSKPRDWRKSLGRHILGFEIEKRHEAELKHIIARLSADPGLVDLLCQVDILPPALYPPAQWSVAKSLFRVLARALVELQLVFAAHNQCDFTEIGLLARHALDQSSGVEDLDLALGARLQHLLVDEMQDTSTGQYDLIQRLTRSWDGHSQTVFLVGDPRQSIYLFRQAQVARFLRTLHTGQLGDLPLTRLRLTANFRSQQTLVQHLNRDFALIFPADSQATDAADLPYQNADPTLPPSPGTTHLTWHASPILPTTPPPTTADLAHGQSLRDARQIAAIASGWLGKTLPPGRTDPWRVAVLVANRSHLTDIVATFKSERIPYRAVDIDSLAGRQEILDLTALARALLHPADRTAALALLRAPWCGLPLADLHLLTGADPAREPESVNSADAPAGSHSPDLRYHAIQRLLADRGHLLSDDSAVRLQRVWHVLSEAATVRARLTPSQLVERVWRTLGGDTWLQQEELANTSRFFLLLEELQVSNEVSGAAIDTAILSTRLERLYAAPAPFPPNQPFVELLTIHKAKGLEWDVVLVPALEKSPAANRTRLLTWAELDPTADLLAESSNDTAAPSAGILLAPIAARGEDVDPLTTWLKRLHSTREAAERKRLFYVACTRAREELHLFAAPTLTAAGAFSLKPASLLRAAWAAAEPHLATALSESAAEPGVSHEAAAAFPLTLDLAASAEAAHPPQSLRPPIQRLPHILPVAGIEIQLPNGDQTLATAATAIFSRPEGSFAARSFGNTIHALVELMAIRILNGLSTAATLLAELPSWTPRISALLRADGLAPATVAQLSRDTRTALENLLRDPEGLWLLHPHHGAAPELALTAAVPTGNLQPATGNSTSIASIRTDLIFLAGPTPNTTAETHLWIVDYKTGSHSAAGLAGFFARQRAAYAPQLETYARILGPIYEKPLTHIRLALYYPMLPHLLWWPLTD